MLRAEVEIHVTQLNCQTLLINLGRPSKTMLMVDHQQIGKKSKAGNLFKENQVKRSSICDLLL